MWDDPGYNLNYWELPSIQIPLIEALTFSVFMPLRWRYLGPEALVVLGCSMRLFVPFLWLTYLRNIKRKAHLVPGHSD